MAEPVIPSVFVDWPDTRSVETTMTNSPPLPPWVEVSAPPLGGSAPVIIPPPSGGIVLSDWYHYGSVTDAGTYLTTSKAPAASDSLAVLIRMTPLTPVNATYTMEWSPYLTSQTLSFCSVLQYYAANRVTTMYDYTNFTNAERISVSWQPEMPDISTFDTSVGSVSWPGTFTTTTHYKYILTTTPTTISIKMTNMLGVEILSRSMPWVDIDYVNGEFWLVFGCPIGYYPGLLGNEHRWYSFTG